MPLDITGGNGVVVTYGKSKKLRIAKLTSIKVKIIYEYLSLNMLTVKIYSPHIILKKYICTNTCRFGRINLQHFAIRTGGDTFHLVNMAKNYSRVGRFKQLCQGERMKWWRILIHVHVYTLLITVALTLFLRTSQLEMYCRHRFLHSSLCSSWIAWWV